MAKQIRIKAGPIEAEGEINDTNTANAIWEALPINARGNLWGEEIYFSIPVQGFLENAQEVVREGDLGYWPPGSAFCIFFGPTPASQGKEIRPASPVTVIGRVVGDSQVFKRVPAGGEVVIERAGLVDEG